MIFFEKINTNSDCNRIQVMDNSTVVLVISIANISKVPFKTAVLLLPSSPLYTFQAIPLIIPINEKKDVFFSFEINKGNLSNINFAIQFSGTMNYTNEVVLEVASNPNSHCLLSKRHFEIALPHQETEGSILIRSVDKLISLLNGYETSSSKGIILELIFKVCKLGRKEIELEKNYDYVNRLKRSTLFKNGILLITNSQILDWIILNYEILKESGSLDNDFSFGETMAGWESLFFNLFLPNFESEELDVFKIGGDVKENMESVFHEIQNSNEKLFIYLLFGLMKTSEKIERRVKHYLNFINIEENNTPSSDLLIFSAVLEEEGTLQS